MNKKADLSIDFCGVKFENPFLLASSPVGNHAEMCERAFDAGWGGIVYKTLANEKTFKIIMPSPRLNAFSKGANRFAGLQNAEQITDRPLDDNIKDIAYLKKKFPKRIMVSSIMAFNDDDWRLLAKRSQDAGADMLELNFSCPQMARKDAGHRIGQSGQDVEHLTNVVKRAVSIPILAKMTPNITDMVPIAMAAKRGGADGISAINTIKAITDIDVENFMPQPNIHGQSGITGFSGRAVKPIALRFISELYNDKDLKLPISAIGGIETWRDALHFILLGGETVQVCTAVMQYGYRIVEDLIEGLSDFMIDRNIKSLKELQGKAACKLVDASEFNTQYQVVAQINKDKCIGCGQCYISCNDGANQAIILDPASRKASVNTNRCVGCTLCKQICPVWDCISVKEIDTSKEKHAAIF